MTKSEFIQELNECRNIQKSLENLLETLIEKVQDEFDVELSEIDYGMENSTSVEDAIRSYVKYGDYEAESIWEELEVL